MINLDELIQYIEENSYSDWSEEEWQKAEKEWADYPVDSDEYRRLLVLRRKRERMLSDEEKYQDFLRRTGSPEAKPFTFPKGPESEKFVITKPDGSVINSDDMIWLCTPTKEQQATINRIFGPKEKKEKRSLEDLLNEGIREFEKKYNIYLSDSALERRANLARGIVWKLRNYGNKTKNRDYMWALALALDFNIEQAGELFESCDSSIEKRPTNPLEERRERLFEFFIKDYSTGPDFDVHVVNDEIERINEEMHLNVKPLGTWD